MCSHILCSRQTFAISGIGSTLAVDVVPTVATTARGLKLLQTSVATISRNVDTFIRRWPSHGVHVQRAGDHFSKNARTRCRGAEVTHELRMGPMRNAGNNHPLHVSEDFVERRSSLWCSCIQLRQDCSGLVIWRNPPLTDMFAIIGNPIGKLMQLLSEFLRWNIAEWLSIFHSSR